MHEWKIGIKPVGAPNPSLIRSKAKDISFCIRSEQHFYAPNQTVFSYEVKISCQWMAKRKATSIPVLTGSSWRLAITPLRFVMILTKSHVMAGGQGQRIFSWTGSYGDSNRYAASGIWAGNWLAQEHTDISPSSAAAQRGAENSPVLGLCPGWRQK